MKNADMPAMPVLNGDNEPANMGSEYYSDKNLATGLTKREMMAMHMASGNMAARTVQWADVNVPMMARIAVEMADALLAELEKQQ